jgi:tetratricopeptide (TPR) repeat protein
MARPRLRFLWLLSCALSCAGALPALAQPSATELQAAKKAAAEHGNRAYDAFHAGNYAEAIVGFQKADKAFHAPRFLVYIARAQVKLGRLSAAKGTYERVVNEQLPVYAPAEFFSAQNEAKQELAELLPRLAPTTEPKLETPPAPSARETDAAPAEPAPTSAPVSSAAPRSGPPVVTTVAFTIGGLGLAVGAAFGGLTLAKRAEFDRHPTKETADQGEAFSNVADASFATALVGAVVGTVVWIVSRSSEPEPKTTAKKGFVTLRVQGMTVVGAF